MPPLTNTASPPAGCPSPVPASRALAEILTNHGFHVHLPYGDESEHLKVTGAAGASCDLTVDDEDGDVSENLSLDTEHGQPGQVAAVVARILGADYTDPGEYAHLHRGVALAGAVARDLQARGLSVTLKAFEDHQEFRVTSEIVITNPDKPQRGEVSLSDGGWLIWDCYADEIPGGICELADTIAATLNPAIHGG